MTCFFGRSGLFILFLRGHFSLAGGGQF